MDQAETQSNYVLANTSYGEVRGRLIDGVHVFKGIPYAADTGGEARFLSPRPRPAWEGVRDALEYGPSAPQRDPDARPDPAVSALIGELSDRPESEDCLVLNIFTRTLSESARRPVMFWLHGGGFQAGSGSAPGYDGRHLVERGDVVVVSINHRLNVFGFLMLSETDGDASIRTGNAGMLDVVEALRWVRDNIARFGGDPERVTIFGESGGGRKVATLLAMPEAKGLFHRAVIQSGPSLRVLKLEEAKRARDALFEQLGIASGDLDALREVPVERLMRAYYAATRKHRFNHVTTGFAPVVEGSVLPAHPFHPKAAEVMPEVPLIAGTNRTEMTLMLAGDQAAFELDEAGLEERARGLLRERAPAVLAAYRASLPAATPSELFFLILSDYRYCAPMMKLAERRAALGGAPVYFYYFTWETPVLGGKLRSPHALEISFVFDNTEISRRLTGGGPRAAALAAKVSSAWIAFATHGKPVAEGLPEWTPYSAPRRATLVIHDSCEMVDDPNAQRRQAMQAAMGLAD